MSLVKVLFDFNAQDVGELSVVVGEVVRLSSTSNRSPQNSGWTLVEKIAPPYGKGYVPTGYLGSAIKGSDVDAGLGSPTSQGLSDNDAGEIEPTKVSSFARIRRLSDPRLPEHLLETLATSDPNSPVVSGSSSRKNYVRGADSEGNTAPSPSTSRKIDALRPKPGKTDIVEFKRPDFHKEKVGVLPIELEKIFARHDHWYEQVMDARSRQYNTMEAALARVNKRMAQAREKSEQIVSNIMQLDAALENDKQKWRSINRNESLNVH